MRYLSDYFYWLIALPLIFLLFSLYNKAEAAAPSAMAAHISSIARTLNPGEASQRIYVTDNFHNADCVAYFYDKEPEHAEKLVYFEKKKIEGVKVVYLTNDPTQANPGGCLD